MALSRLLAVAMLCLSPASAQEVLQHTGKALESFWDRLSQVNCVETVQQAKLGPGGKVVYRQDSSFDYLVLLQLTGNEMLVDESRSPIAEGKEQKNVPLLITNGFSMLAFIFHPFFQSAFEYSAPEPVEANGASLWQVRFRHVAGARSPSVLKLRQRDYPVEWQGTAWIDRESGAVVRISAGLMSSMEDLGLKSLNADVKYGRVGFKGDAGTYWLPETAAIEVETARQHWRNLHTFGKYRLFAVDVKTNVETPK
ncbi:MAG: hypothetical protein LAQ69_05965 [Acidobacteriia bacterium]|nr:hypothetical protein [Terriglobia bacterium]